jgi:lysyl-tRNA synthetase class II
MSETPSIPVQDENQIIHERREKLAAIRQQGGIAFPNDFNREHYAGDLHTAYHEKTKEELYRDLKMLNETSFNKKTFIAHLLTYKYQDSDFY